MVYPRRRRTDFLSSRSGSTFVSLRHMAWHLENPNPMKVKSYIELEVPRISTGLQGQQAANDKNTPPLFNDLGFLAVAPDNVKYFAFQYLNVNVHFFRPAFSPWDHPSWSTRPQQISNIEEDFTSFFYICFQKKGQRQTKKKGHLVDVTREPPEGWYEWETVAMKSDVCFFESSREHLPTFFLTLNLLHSTENAVKGAQEGEGIWLLEQASELTQLTQKGTKKIIRILLRGDNPEHEDKYMILLKRPLDYKMANLFGDKTWMFSCEVEERRWWIVGRSNFQISCCLVMVRVRANRPFGVLRVFARLLPFLLVLWECRSGTWPLRAVINSISGIHRI